MTENETLIALAPADMPSAQASIVEFCDKKMMELQAVVTDLEQNLVIAKRNRWGSRKSLETTIRREQKRVVYYSKMKAAVQAGYLIVPNFPINTFAVRVSADSPRWKSDSYISNALRDAKPELALPPGEGRYVDDQHSLTDNRWQAADPKDPNKTVTRGSVVVDGYDDVDLPLAAVKPMVLSAIEQAMKSKIFDRIGLVGERQRGQLSVKRDPIVVGQIIDPRETSPDWRGAKVVTFFIAWWLDLKSL
jgi:hypothetical protein